MRLVTFSLFIVLCGAFTAQAPPAVPQVECTSPEKPFVHTTLTFGRERSLAAKPGTVSEREWKAFLRDEVTPRFPKGFTVFDGNGQYRLASGRIVHEKSKVLSVLNDGSPEVRKNVAAIIAAYKQKFEQEAVLWETAHVCAAFD